MANRVAKIVRHHAAEMFKRGFQVNQRTLMRELEALPAAERGKRVRALEDIDACAKRARERVGR